ncbi:GmrSD restriction endonuclease domain-containing protein (plasmid) [Haloarcula salina]|uniref:GmrSD restriction endonuclease domain-containing protein n=1 Tax=Haloarcula salina TaxID=1429914 RepID=UPI003C6F595A
MYDQRVTIREAVRRIENGDYLLPAIQREIVWEREQITDLFDSVLQGYPIGTFLYWDLHEENWDEYTMYGFIKNYITSTKWIETDAQTRNSKAKPDGAGDLKLILDGQQRLSSFYIGLKGTYTYKEPYQWYRNRSSWTKSRLYLNLSADPRVKAEEGGDRNTRYQFEFLSAEKYDQALVRHEDDWWFRAGAILNYSDTMELRDYIDKKTAGLEIENEGVFRQNLFDLQQAVHDQKYITYFEEQKQDIDRVLEIFIRTNDGGTQLSKSDLLLSIAQANWKEYDAREELTSFVDHLNTQLPMTNSYGKDFLLKSSLVLADLPVRYRVSQFKRENVAKMEAEWPEIRRAIEEAATLVNNFGIGGQTLLSRNAVIPIAYYFKQTGLTAEKLRRDERERVQTKRDIKRWLLTSLLHGTFSGSADSVLNRIREVLNDEPGETFPVAAIETEMADLGKVTGFNEEMIDNVLEYTKGGNRTFLTLTLLYDQIDFGSIQYHQDHIFPSALLTEDRLLESGLDRDRAKAFDAHADRLANLQLLTGRENEAKQDTPVEEWLASRDESFYDRHLIPTDPETHRIENFDLFLERRSELIREELQSVLGPIEE